ncbi:MAG: peptidoglycan-binding protein, partial [Gammaproteobacteria bacterium]
MKNIFPLPLLFAALLLLNLSSCSTSSEPVDGEIIRQKLTELKSSDSSENDPIYAYIEKIYSLTGNQLIWDEESKAEALNILGNAEIHGLNSDDYRYEELLTNEEGESSLSELETDIGFTYGMLLFGHHMLEGRTRPEQFFKDWAYKRRDFSETTAELLVDCIREHDLNRYVQSVMPEGGFYEGLMLWMEKYYNGDYDLDSKISFDKLPVNQGESHPGIIEIKYRLSQYDSYSSDQPSELFDEELETALIDFQTKMGLPADGIIDQGTLDALNMSP